MNIESLMMNPRRKKIAFGICFGVIFATTLNSMMPSMVVETSPSEYSNTDIVSKLKSMPHTSSKRIRNAESRLAISPTAIQSKTNQIKNTTPQKMHMALLSDRYEGMAVTVNSICQSSNHKQDLVFHIFTDNKDVVRTMYNKLPHCKEATLNLISIEEATTTLKQMGFDPFWNRAFPDTTGKWALETPYTTDKHAHPLNLLRFYLPHLPDFDNVDRFIFLDDDLVFMKDVAELKHYKIPNDNVMASGCRHWIWNSAIPGNFETSTHFTVDETGYIGPMDTKCVENRAEGDDIVLCTHDGLKEKLAEVSVRIDPDAPMADRPLDRIAFNMGLNIIDIQKWKALRLSEKFERWVEASIWERLFAPDTLAFGLGLGYFAMTAYSECYDDEIEHLVGLGFVTKESLGYVGWTTEDMKKKAFALHYNGGGKPWKAPMPSCTKETADHILDDPQNALEIWQKSCIDAEMCHCNMTVAESVAAPVAESVAAPVAESVATPVAEGVATPVEENAQGRRILKSVEVEDHPMFVPYSP